MTKWLMYGAGPYLMKCMELRVKDIDMARSKIIIRDGKGTKDRCARIPELLKKPLAEYLRAFSVGRGR